MRTRIFNIVFVCLFVCPGFASYTYEVYTYGESKWLESNQSILIADEGGMPTLILDGNSYSNIIDTSILEQGTGGIWTIESSDNSTLEMSGGQVHEIAIGNDATAFLSGGLIEQIWSSQWVSYTGGGHGEPGVPNPHITIECLDHVHNEATNLLTGHWLDSGTAFSIQLIDVQGYDPAIENIDFIPEPATLLLFGLGGLVLRKKTFTTQN